MIIGDRRHKNIISKTSEYEKTKKYNGGPGAQECSSVMLYASYILYINLVP